MRWNDVNRAVSGQWPTDSTRPIVAGWPDFQKVCCTTKSSLPAKREALSVAWIVRPTRPNLVGSGFNLVAFFFTRSRRCWGSVYQRTGDRTPRDLILLPDRRCRVRGAKPVSPMCLSFRNQYLPICHRSRPALFLPTAQWPAGIAQV